MSCTSPLNPLLKLQEEKGFRKQPAMFDLQAGQARSPASTEWQLGFRAALPLLVRALQRPQDFLRLHPRGKIPGEETSRSTGAKNRAVEVSIGAFPAPSRRPGILGSRKLEPLVQEGCSSGSGFRLRLQSFLL